MSILAFLNAVWIWKNTLAFWLAFFMSKKTIYILNLPISITWGNGFQEVGIATRHHFKSAAQSTFFVTIIFLKQCNGFVKLKIVLSIWRCHSEWVSTKTRPCIVIALRNLSSREKKEMATKWKGHYDTGRKYSKSWEAKFSWVSKMSNGTENAFCKLYRTLIQPRAWANYKAYLVQNLACYIWKWHQNWTSLEKIIGRYAWKLIQPLFSIS